MPAVLVTTCNYTYGTYRTYNQLASKLNPLTSSLRSVKIKENDHLRGAERPGGARQRRALLFSVILALRRLLISGCKLLASWL